MRPDEEPRPSWICHNEFERARFMDLHARLLRANHAILLMLIVAIAFALPLVSGRLGVIPAAAGNDPFVLSLLLVAIVSVHTVSTVLRDSDVEHRGAAILDPLTGMLNRAALVNRTAEIEHQSRLTGEPVAVILLDLDRFKLVNDTRGHATGDIVLREVA